MRALAPWPVEWIDPAPAIARRAVAVAGKRSDGRGGGRAFLTSGRGWPPALTGLLAAIGLEAVGSTPSGGRGQRFDTIPPGQ
jgi:glutamate racemase